MNASDTAGPGLAAELLGKAAYVFAEAQPYIPMYLHLILSALFPIYTGAHASLVRPSSAAKPLKKTKKKSSSKDDSDSDDDDDDDDVVTKMEGMSPRDAILFPVLAGCTLGGLYLLIKWMGPSLLNKILRWYFSSIAIFGVSRLLMDSSAVIESFIWPDLYTDQGVIWRLDGASRRAVAIGEADARERTSPLPGILGRVGLPTPITNALWFLRQQLAARLSIRFHLRKVLSFEFIISFLETFCIALGLSAIVVSNVFSSAWWLTNLQGFAFSYNALQLMSPTTFSTGSLILAALFFYDIYFVFYTPIMVTVATNLDVPIKLLFPRPAEQGQTTRQLAMLGLGDIVLPGIMIGLALRFDLYMHYLRLQRPPSNTTTSSSSEPLNKSVTPQKVIKAPYNNPTGNWGNAFWTYPFLSPYLTLSPLAHTRPLPSLRTSLIPTFNKPYFYASLAGYVAGMCATLAVMQVYAHAQPALLYLVPGVLAAIWGTAVVRGELQEVWGFSEASAASEGKESSKAKRNDKSINADGEKSAVEDKKPGEEKDSEKEKTQDNAATNTTVAEPSQSSSWWSKLFTYKPTSSTAKPTTTAPHATTAAQVPKSRRERKIEALLADEASQKPFALRIKRLPPKVKRFRFEGGGSSLSDRVEAVDTRDASVEDEDEQPKWSRASGSGVEMRDERAGKRLRTR